MKTGIFFAFLLTFLLLLHLVSADCNYYGGDWLINETVICNETLTLNGSILIDTSGHLTLENATILMNVTSNGGLRIEVNGTLMLVNTTIRSVTDKRYLFYANEGSNLTIYASTIKGVGVSSGEPKKRGLYIGTDNVKITSNEFLENFYALLIYSSNNTVAGNRFLSNTGIVISGDNNLFYNNLIQGQINELYISGANITIANNNISGNSDNGLRIKTEYSLIFNNTLSDNENGVLFEGNQTNITGNTIQSNKKGLEISGDRNIIYGNLLKNNDIGLIIQGSDNYISGNDIIDNSLDIYLFSAYDTSIKNTTYVTLQRNYSVVFKTLNLTGYPVSNANIKLIDSFNRSVYSGLTNSNGETPQLMVTVFYENGTSYDYNPFFVNTSKEGYKTNESVINIKSSGYVEIFLNKSASETHVNQTNATLNIILLSPENKTYLKGDLTDGILLVNVRGDANLSRCVYFLEATSGNMSKTDNATFDAEVNVSSMEGVYKLSVVCKSLAGATNSTTVWFTVYPAYECFSDYDCESNEICENHECVRLECECGYAENHECVSYECCGDEVCSSEEYCNLNTHKCEIVPCKCGERKNHECILEPGHCCTDAQCEENETCVNGICVEQILSLEISGEIAVGKIVKIKVSDQDGNPVENVKIEVSYVDDPEKKYEYYTDINGVADVPVLYAGRVQIVARKANYVTGFTTEDVPEPFNWFFLVEAAALIFSIIMIVFILLKLLPAIRSPFRLEKTVSGTSVMLKIKNRTNKKIFDMKVVDYVPRGSFMRCNIKPEIEHVGSDIDMLKWTILELNPKEEIVIQYEASGSLKGFSVEVDGREYKIGKGL